MRHEQSHDRLRIFGSIALGVAVLAVALSTVFTSSDATATSKEAHADSAMADSQSARKAQAESSRTRSSPSIDSVRVTLSTGTLSVPETIPAGSAAFKVVNNGQEEHSFAIGAAMQAEAKARLDGLLKAGQSEVLTAKLQPGTYLAYCPVEGHQARERTAISIERSHESR